MKYAAILFMAGWLALFFPRKNSYGGQTPPGIRDKAAYAVLSVVALSLCVLQQLNLFPMIARWMDNGMMFIYRMTGGSGS